MLLGHSNVGGVSGLSLQVFDGDRQCRDVGLGGYPPVSHGPGTPQGRRRQTAETILSEKRKPLTPTFREATLTVHETNRPRWRSAKQTKN